MAQTQIDIGADGTFTDPMRCIRDSVLVVLNPEGGTGAGTVTVQIRDYSDPANPGVWEDWDRRAVASGDCQAFILDCCVSNQQIRVGFKAGEYVAGTLTGRIQTG